MSTEAKALQTCGVVVLFFAVSLAALGSACLHLAWSYPPEYQDPEISGWLPLLSGLGMSAFVCGLSFLVGCTCLDACLLSRRGCGGGGSMFRLGLAGICIVPFLFMVSMAFYVCFWRSVLRRWEHRFSAPDQSWFEECRWVVIGGVLTHALILAFCIRIVALFTCFYKGGVGSYHEFDNPSFLTMIGRRPSSSLPFYASYQTQTSYLSQSSHGMPYQVRADSVSSLKTPPQSTQTTLRVPGSGGSSRSHRRRTFSFGRRHRDARSHHHHEYQEGGEMSIDDNKNDMIGSLGGGDHDRDHDDDGSGGGGGGGDDDDTGAMAEPLDEPPRLEAEG
eukprot:CAMPEP_0170181028 /NCGR_PEP_ID=MMETSP0040_2-20121228/23738_1 /TAXON_ID=641309 /ORGANISM="Lotharella oceanica, Strain CCMP622" /LENGTH=332 /DNA_ID=CAMNT_0010425889 /DNA_START=115 /DNA_END=1113 /DNA_ORIENTATION=+